MIHIESLVQCSPGKCFLSLNCFPNIEYIDLKSCLEGFFQSAKLLQPRRGARDEASEESGAYRDSETEGERGKEREMQVRKRDRHTEI
jgi:hypothetical protein